MSEPQELVGQHIGPYRIEEYLAQGGMADVYLAYDENLDRQVALKILLPEFTRDKEFVERFQREAKTAAQLHHPNMVQIYLTGLTDDRHHYIAMEYIKSGTLDQKLRQLAEEKKLFKPAYALALVRQIADALALAHQAGIVHRDLKPSNVLLRPDGRPVLTDLGIAIVANNPRLTRTNALMGTPDYMSPEQVRGEVLDGRSDIYSLGIVLYELLTGSRPFVADSPWAVTHKQLYEEPTPLKAVRKGLSAKTYRIVETCLQKESAKRYQTTAQLLKALDEALAAEGGSDYVTGTAKWAGPESDSLYTGRSGVVRLVTNSTRRHSRRWRFYLLVSLLLAIIILGAGYAGQVYSMLPFGTRPPLVSVVTATPTTSTTATATEDVQWITQTAVNLPTSTLRPTITPVPTNTPTSTNTPIPTPTLTPIPTPTRIITPTIGPGMPIRFESTASWISDNDGNGTLVSTSDQFVEGRFGGQMQYNFTTAGNDFVLFYQLNNVSGTPNVLQAWVMGDGSGNILSARIRDRQGVVWDVPFGPVQHTGWHQMRAYLHLPWATTLDGTAPADPLNPFAYPIQFLAFALDDPSNDYSGQGIIYLDNLAPLTIPQLALETLLNYSDTLTTTEAVANPTVEFSELGRVLFSINRQLYLADPDWRTPLELGQAALDSCGSPALTETGQSYELDYGHFCSIRGSSNVCLAPDGQNEAIVVNHDDISIVSVRPVGEASSGTFIYQGVLDLAAGVRWSPLSDRFLFVGDEKIQTALTDGTLKYISVGYNPSFSPSGNYILYQRTMLRRRSDIFVSNVAGGPQLNISNTPTVDEVCVAWRTSTENE